VTLLLRTPTAEPFLARLVRAMCAGCLVPPLVDAEYSYLSLMLWAFSLVTLRKRNGVLEWDKHACAEEPLFNSPALLGVQRLPCSQDSKFQVSVLENFVFLFPLAFTRLRGG
jgi:hypothetical protein